MTNYDKIREKGWIYRIWCVGNSSYYIGSTTDLKKRWVRHCKKGPNPKFRNVWDKYGPALFEFEVLEEFDNVSLRFLQDVETSYLQFVKKTDKKKSLNLKFQGTGGNGGAVKGKKMPNRKSPGPMSEEQKRKQSERQKGKPSPNKGKKHPNRKPMSEEQKRKLSERAKGKKLPPRSEEYRQKMRETWKRRKERRTE
jgi:group I intron endonuclease